MQILSALKKQEYERGAVIEAARQLANASVVLLNKARRAVLRLQALRALKKQERKPGASKRPRSSPPMSPHCARAAGSGHGT